MSNKEPPQEEENKEPKEEEQEIKNLFDVEPDSMGFTYPHER
jgi:hypothetical protein